MSKGAPRPRTSLRPARPLARRALRFLWRIIRIFLMAGIALAPAMPPPPPPPRPVAEQRYSESEDETPDEE